MGIYLVEGATQNLNKISLYVLLVLIFLGLSKSFAPAEKKTVFIANKEYLSIHYSGAPLSVILIDSFQTGFLIKTFYQKYKIFHGFKSPEIVTVRTSKNFWNETKSFQGMSLFRRAEKNNEESYTPMPPGSLYIGDPSFGRFENKSGEKLWKFHRAYKHYPEVFFWGDFRPTYAFFKTGFLHQKNDSPYYGLNNEFGENGIVTKEVLHKLIDSGSNLKRASYERNKTYLNNSQLKQIKRRHIQKKNLKEHIKQFFKLPKWEVS